MRKTDGKVRFGGRLAYCAQVPWIQNATLVSMPSTWSEAFHLIRAPKIQRDNVIFGREFEEEKYWRIITDSCLFTDLQILPDGDLTEVCTHYSIHIIPIGISY